MLTADFESWPATRSDFDAVVAFGAFHWVRPDRRYAKSADLLRPHGMLAFVSTAHVLPTDGDPFFVEVQADYEAVVPEGAGEDADAFFSPPWRLPHPDALGDHSDDVVNGELEASGRFRRVGARHYVWDVVYDADDYVAVLDTYSHHRAFDDETRARLFERIHRRIESRPGGNVRATYLALLYVAERLT